MTLWMLWSILFTAVVGIVALAIDHAARAIGAPRRHVWLAALLVAAIVPVVLATRRAEPSVVLPGEVATTQTIDEPIAQTVATTGATSSDETIEEASLANATTSRFTVDAKSIDRAAVTLC